MHVGCGQRARACADPSLPHKCCLTLTGQFHGAVSGKLLLAGAAGAAARPARSKRAMAAAAAAWASEPAHGAAGSWCVARSPSSWVGQAGIVGGGGYGQREPQWARPSWWHRFGRWWACMATAAPALTQTHGSPPRATTRLSPRPCRPPAGGAASAGLLPQRAPPCLLPQPLPLPPLPAGHPDRQRAAACCH